MDHPTGLDLDRVQNVAGIIERSGRRLQRLIENYLYFAQLELIAGDHDRRAEFKTHSVSNPGGVIYEAAKERSIAHQRPNDLQLQLDNAVIAIAEDNLQKIVAELVDNAYKFSQPGTQILVETRINGDVFSVRVVDHGRGMTEEEVQSIDPFAQFQRTLFEQQGVGLGLAIVRRLTDLYGGQFSLVSNPGQGTDVMVMLPIH
jgi:signal transduction histidine kinase